MRSALFIVVLGVFGLLSACSAPKPPARDLPAYNPQMPAQEVADFNQLFEKYGTPALPDVAKMPEFTPDVVINAYLRNQREADALYGHKWMKVRGTLVYGPTSEGFGGLDMYYVGLGSTGKRMACIFTGARHQQELAGLKHGQTLVVVGVYAPGERYNPKLLGCSLLSAE
jgi:hypothetical protein